MSTYGVIMHKMVLYVDLWFVLLKITSHVHIWYILRKMISYVNIRFKLCNMSLYIDISIYHAQHCFTCWHIVILHNMDSYLDLCPLNLKPDSHLPIKIIFVCVNESPLKIMKNAFYFILKALFILKIFKFLCFHVEETA